MVDQPRLPGVATVVLDDAGGAREAARHLLALGHRRFGIVSLPCLPDGYTGPGDPARIASSAFDITAARFAGYAEALAAAGVAIGGSRSSSAPTATKRSGRRPPATCSPAERPTAVLAMNDRLAIGVMAAARAPGSRFPVTCR